MNLSTSKKVFIVVLALALAALGVDRVFLQSGQSEPQPATASPGAVAPDAEAKLGAPSTAAPAAHEPIAEKLRKVSSRMSFDAANVREVFLPPSTWPGLVKAEIEAAPPPKPSLAELFAREHHLTSVAVVQGGGTAIIDGNVVQLGETVDGFSLISVKPDHVILRAGADEVRLQMLGGHTPSPTGLPGAGLGRE